MNIYTPKLTLTQYIEHLRYARIERELKPLCKWVDFYDYIWSYGSMDWKGKSVLDIGADIGSSAYFFLSKGASEVYLAESDPQYRKQYQVLKKTIPLLQRSMLLPLDWKQQKADVLKMDCEGCELALLGEELLENYSEWIIGLHKPQLDSYQFEQKKKLLERHGGRYHGSINADIKEGSEYVWIKRK